MTMLDRMRRHKGWLKWSLALVVLAFVMFYVPEFCRDNRRFCPRRRPSPTSMATPITVGEYQARPQQSPAAVPLVRAAICLSDMLKQLGIDRQVLQSLIDQRAVEAEARRRGIA